MAATVDTEPVLGFGEDAVQAYLSQVLTSLGGLISGGGPVDAGVRIDRISLLEKIKAAAGAVQAAEIVKFAQAQVAEQKDAQVHPRRLGRGVAEQLGLATRTGPWHGSRRLSLARDLWFDLPASYALLARGEISEYVAQLVATETNHLDPELRRRVDQQLIDAGLDQMGPKEAAAAARKLAQQADPHGSLARGRTARKHRRVTCRPAPDTMSLLNALLPVEQGVACYAALKHHTDTIKAGGDDRSRDQIMADTLVERLTGQTAADQINTEINLIMPLDTLIQPGAETSAEIPGFGPIPGWVTRQLAASHGPARRWWRRLFTTPAPDGGVMIVGGDPTRRRFDGWLGRLITLRDQTCREPYCTAPIRHLDHVTPYRDGGLTTYSNGRGVCERHNYTREMPGWQIELLSNRPHTTITVTPTGHSYHSRAPNPP